MSVDEQKLHFGREQHSEDEVSVLDEVVETDDEENSHDENDHGHQHQHSSSGGGSSSVEEDALSLDYLLQEKDAKIECLERANRIQKEQFELLQNKMNETKVKQREGVYWLQLELDAARRDKDATEEQMAELLNDLQGMTTLPNPLDVPPEVFQNDMIQSLERRIASLEHQKMMIQTSAGEVVKTLKEEISELMEDRASMEVDLLNQLAALDQQKCLREAELEYELKKKADMIDRLLSAGGTTTTSSESADIEEYEAEISRLVETNKALEDELRKERTEAFEEVQKLELSNAALKADLDRAGEIGEVDTMTAVQLIAKEREETMSALHHVADIWEKADAAILALEDSMDRLRPDETIPADDDRNRLLSTLETAALVHGQIKVSLMLVELKLRNQMQSLKNDTLNMGSERPSDEFINQKMNVIQDEVLKVLTQVDTTLSIQIDQLQQRAMYEMLEIKGAIQNRSANLVTMQEEHAALEKEIGRLREILVTSATPANASKEEEGKSSSTCYSGKSPTDSNKINEQVLDQLHFEVHRIIKRMQEKNSLIESLRVKLEESKASEERLKVELKRALRKPRVSIAGGAAAKTKSPETRTEAAIQIKSGESPARTSPRAVVSSRTSPTAAVPQKSLRDSRRLDSEILKSSTTSGTQNNHSSHSNHVLKISPLAPSPREISKRRLSLMPPSPPSSPNRPGSRKSLMVAHAAS